MSTNAWHSHAVSSKQLDKQIRAWEEAKRERLAKPSAGRPEIEECVCISREAGAGGSEVARMLGEKLGWAVFDQELLHMMAGDDAARERVYASMDERDMTWFENVLRSFADPDFRKNDYLHKLSQAMLSIARQGHAVFLGRGANRLLPRSAILSVRLVAPLDVRIARYAERRSLDRAAARKQVEKVETERAQFILRHFHTRVDDAVNYDLIINTGSFAPPAAVELISTALRMRAKHPENA
jgi:cytidylate kinase